jgi:hypothetical protein
MTLNF